MMDKQFDYSMYGVFNGKPTLPKYNREQKRKYIKKHKHNKDATRCDYCNADTLTFIDDNSSLVCELCGRIKTAFIKTKITSNTTEVCTAGYFEIMK